jgi:hypothetical protein
MYHTTGFTKAQITDLCAMIWKENQDSGAIVWPPILGLYKSMVVTLTYLRRNRVQVELAETFDVSQPTVSRAMTALTPVLGRVLADYVPVPEDLDERRQYIVDRTLLPCWSWAGHRELYSGKHKTTGRCVQVACLHSGVLAWISDPVDGSRHDSFAIRQSGVLDTFDPGRLIGDKGVRRPRHAHTDQETAAPGAVGLGEGIQHPDQQGSLCHRADHRELQDVESPPHRLPPATEEL